MSKIFDINNFNERLKFEIKLQISLRKNAINVQGQSQYPDRFIEYIKEREERLRKLVGTTADFAIVDGEKQIYP